MTNQARLTTHFSTKRDRIAKENAREYDKLSQVASDRAWRMTKQINVFAERPMDFRDQPSRTLDGVQRVLSHYAPCATHVCPGPDAGKDIELEKCWRCYAIQAIRRSQQEKS
jgi:hypothetical protein